MILSIIWLNWCLIIVKGNNRTHMYVPYTLSMFWLLFLSDRYFHDSTRSHWHQSQEFLVALLDTLFEKLVRTIKLPLRTTYFDTKKLPFCTTSFNRIECTGCHEITPFEISQYRIEPAIIQAPISKFNTLAECIRDVFRSEVIVIMFNFLSFFFLTTVNHFSQNVELNCDSCKTPFATQKLEIRSFPVLLCIMINRHATAIVDDVSKTAVPMGDAGVFVAAWSIMRVNWVCPDLSRFRVACL